jgi:hypothetical protein
MQKTDRPTKARPCRVCGGYASARRGSESSCRGYTRETGWTVCMKRESPHPDGNGGWAHPPDDRASGLNVIPPPPPPTKAPDPVAPAMVFDPATLPLEKLGHQSRPGWKATRFDVAHSLAGQMAVQVRYEGADEKTFRYWTYGADGWKATLRDIDRGALWFGLPEALARPDAPVLMVEGPKTREKAAELFPDHAVVSPAGGKDSIANADLTPFRGRRVTLWPDADKSKPGTKTSQERFADAAERLANEGAAEVRFLTPPAGLPDGWDLADPAPAGLDVRALLEGADVVADARPQQRWLMSSLSEVSSMEPIPWMVENTFRANSLILLFGESGAGKSWTALDLACSVATGTSWGDNPTRRGRVLYVTLEDCKQGTLPRARAWEKDRGISIPDDTLKLIDEVVPLDDKEDVSAFIGMVQGSGFKPDLIIFDTLALSTAGIDENTAKDSGAVIGNVKRIQRELDSAVMLVHHARKDDPRAYRGSTSWMAAMDTMISVVKLDDGLMVQCEKQRSAPKFGATRWKLEAVPDVMWGETQMVTTRYIGGDRPGLPGNQAAGPGGALTPNRRNVLRTIKQMTLESGGGTQAEISSRIDLSKQSVSDACQWLKANNHVLYDAEKKRWHTSREDVPHFRSHQSMDPSPDSPVSPERSPDHHPDHHPDMASPERPEHTPDSRKPAQIELPGYQSEASGFDSGPESGSPSGPGFLGTRSDRTSTGQIGQPEGPGEGEIQLIPPCLSALGEPL